MSVQRVDKNDTSIFIYTLINNRPCNEDSGASTFNEEYGYSLYGKTINLEFEFCTELDDSFSNNKIMKRL